MATLKVVFDQFGGNDSKPLVIDGIEPKSATVHFNGYRDADTFEMEFDAKRLPFSPELIRAMEVQISMFDAGSMSTDPRTLARDPKNLMISGLVDNASIHYSSQGRTFRVDGRDYTSLFLDKPWDPTKRVPTGRSLMETLQELADQATFREETGPDGKKRRVGADLQVVFVGSPEDYRNMENALVGERSVTATVGQSKVDKKGKITVPTTGQGHSKSNKRGIPQKEGMNYWDVMYRLCVQHGFICYVRGHLVVLSTPNVLTAANAETTVRHIAVGKNVSYLDIQRHLGRETVPQIVCSGYEKGTGKLIKAAFPENYKGRLTSVGTRTEEKRFYTFGQIRDQEALRAIAKAKYQSLARTESTLRVGTRDLESLNGMNLLSLRTGHPVAISFEFFNREDLRKNPQAAYSKMISEGFAPEVAALVANNLDKIKQFHLPFYTKQVEVSWSTEDGINIDIEAVNFVSVKRDDVDT